jgi:hypothetical protein
MSQPVLGDSDAGPRWFVYVCPYCGQQYRGPSGHHVAGDDRATSCFHAHEGERGITQPKLVRARSVLTRFRLWRFLKPTSLKLEPWQRRFLRKHMP